MWEWKTSHYRKRRVENGGLENAALWSPGPQECKCGIGKRGVCRGARSKNFELKHSDQSPNSNPSFCFFSATTVVTYVSHVAQ